MSENSYYSQQELEEQERHALEMLHRDASNPMYQFDFAYCSYSESGVCDNFKYDDYIEAWVCVDCGKIDDMLNST